MLDNAHQLTETFVRRGQCRGVDPTEVVRRFHGAVSQPDMGFVVFFCSSRFDLDVIAREITRCFAGIPVVGCTTAGEIGPEGYCEGTISGASFAASHFTFVAGHLDKLSAFNIAEGYTFAQHLLQRLEAAAPDTGPTRSFSFLLVDGVSKREEPVAHTLQDALDGIAMVGGSAGDDLRFGATHVYVDGAFHRDSAALVIGTTDLPFKVFKTQHFVATDQRLVVTKADVATRVVQEVDGLPAAQEYSRLLGVSEQALDAARFAAMPVVMMIDGTNYVRSIQRVRSDQSLEFYCAIEPGVVLRLAKGVDLVANLDKALEDLRADIGPPQIVLAFDCVLRRLEIVQNHLEGAVGKLLTSSNATGFNTYGEQFRGVHVNQTMTGLAIGSPRPESASV
jgi:hypothetical protein